MIGAGAAGLTAGHILNKHGIDLPCIECLNQSHLTKVFEIFASINYYLMNTELDYLNAQSLDSNV